MQERISRRDVLFLLGDAAVLGFWGYLCYPFTGLLELDNPKIKASDLNILTPSETFIKGVRKETPVRVGINKEEIAKAILSAAKMVDPVYGQAKVYELLKKRPLKITFGGEPKERYHEGKPYVNLAEYRSYLQGGPKIIL